MVLLGCVPTCSPVHLVHLVWTKKNNNNLVLGLAFRLAFNTKPKGKVKCSHPDWLAFMM